MIEIFNYTSFVIIYVYKPNTFCYQNYCPNQISKDILL